MDDIKRILQHRSNFLSILNRDYEKNKSSAEAVNKEIDECNTTLKAVKELGEKVEHVSLLKLSPRLYAPGKITHTGEFTVNLSTNTDSYKTLLTLAQTVQYLQNKILAKNKLLEQIEINRNQLEERIKLITPPEKDDHDAVTDNENMPHEIHSDKGVAFRVGEFYEIFEYEE